MYELMSDSNSYTSMREALNRCLCEIQARDSNIEITGIPTGFLPIDNLIGGFERGKVYVIGGRPNMGKEELMLSMIRDIVIDSKLSVLLFSTNRMKSLYVQRLLSIYCDIPTLRLHHGTLERNEWEKIDKEVDSLADAPIFFHDVMDLPLNELVETTRDCIKEKGIKIIFIDCLQMIDFTNEDRTPSERIAKVMYSLKQLAYITDVPIVVGSMLGRSIEYREDLDSKRPQLMDLTNSSYIEELADVVMMVHRPEYYHIYVDDNGRDLRSRIEIIVRKNALKPLGSILLEYNEKTGAIKDKNE